MSSHSENFVIGVLLSLLAALVSSLGVNLQASALVLQRERHLQEELEADEQVESIISNIEEELPLTPERRAALNSHESPFVNNDSERPDSISLNPRVSTVPVAKSLVSLQWYIGFMLYISCQVFGSATALNFIPPEIVAPLGSTGLIFNMIFAKIFLGTPITRKDWVSGCSLVSLIGSADSPGKDDKNTVQDLINLYTQPGVIVYFSIQIGCVVFLLSLVKYLGYGGPLQKFQEQVEPNSALLSNSRVSFHHLVEDAPSESIDSEITPLIPHPRLSRRKSSSLSMLISSSRYLRFRRWLRRKNRSIKIVSLIGALYSIVGGISASDTLVLANSGIDLLVLTLRNSNQSHILFSLLLVSFLVATVVLQLYSLNCGLNYSLPTIVVPLFYTFYTCLSLVNSLIISSMKEYPAKSSPWSFWLILLGIIMILGGVWMLGEKETEIAAASVDVDSLEASKQHAEEPLLIQ